LYKKERFMVAITVSDRSTIRPQTGKAQSVSKSPKCRSGDIKTYNDAAYSVEYVLMLTDVVVNITTKPCIRQYLDNPVTLVATGGHTLRF